MVAIQVGSHRFTVTHSNQFYEQVLCYPLHFPFFWTPLLGFIVYLSSRLSPNESISLYGLITLNVKWFPYVLVAFDMVTSPMIGSGTIAGLLVAQVLFMLEFETPEGNALAEPTLKPQSKLRAPDWLSRLLVEPEVQRTGAVRTVYGTATAPARRGLGDLGKGANVPGSSGYNWGKGHKLGGT
jgi:Derlin-2/3